MQAIIFANGDFNAPTDLDERLAAADLIIAADGGAQHCQALKLSPNVIIGDLDSISPEIKSGWEAKGAQVIQYPADKDQTDLELALLHAKQVGATKIHVLGALGKRSRRNCPQMRPAVGVIATD